jgi:hypothetical protein
MDKRYWRDTTLLVSNLFLRNSSHFVLRRILTYGIFNHHYTKGRPIWRITTTNR